MLLFPVIYSLIFSLKCWIYISFINIDIFFSSKIKTEIFSNLLNFLSKDCIALNSFLNIL